MSGSFPQYLHMADSTSVPQSCNNFWLF